MQFFRNIRFELRYMFEELWIKVQHPKRECEVYYHFSKLLDHLFGHPWYCLKRGIRNLFIWFPIIWRNDVYDHFYLQELIDKQLEEMEAFWKSDYPWSSGAYHIAKRIAWTRKMYRMSRDEFYAMQNYDKFKDESWEFKTEPCNWDEYGIPILFRSVDTKTPEEKELYMKASDIAHKKDQKCYDLYAKGLSRMNFWWD